MTSAKQFRKQRAARFDMEELRLLAFALQVDWDELDGYRKSTKIQSLIEWMKRRQRLPELIATLHEERADEKWPDVSTLAAALTDEGGHSVGRNRQNILRNIHFT
jgi:hypothetical protein